jgi:hypothetical protein
MTENYTNISECKINRLRESVNTLTDEVVKQLNDINRTLTEIEKQKKQQHSQD